MQYLLREVSKKKRKRRPAVAHLWDGTDTACRMWSTGGIRAKKRYRVSGDPEGRPICTMCAAPSLDTQMHDAMARDEDPRKECE